MKILVTPIKNQADLDSVLRLIRTARKEARRFASKDRAATAKYWESVIDGYLLEEGGFSKARLQYYTGSVRNEQKNIHQRKNHRR
jgi:hypothetical protein